MSIYSDKLSHVQVVNNCQNTNAQRCNREDLLAYISGASIDDVMSYNSLTCILIPTSKHIFIQIRRNQSQLTATSASFEWCLQCADTFDSVTSRRTRQTVERRQLKQRQFGKTIFGYRIWTTCIWPKLLFNALIIFRSFSLRTSGAKEFSSKLNTKLMLKSVAGILYYRTSPVSLC